MTRRKEKLIALAAVFVALALGLSPWLYCCFGISHFSRVPDADTFRIKKGMTRDEVQAMLGRPNHTESGGRFWAYYTWEGGLLAPLFPVYITFDDQGRVQAVFV